MSDGLITRKQENQAVTISLYLVTLAATGPLISGIPYTF